MTRQMAQAASAYQTERSSTGMYSAARVRFVNVNSPEFVVKAK